MKLVLNRLVSGSKWAPFILVWKRNCVEKGYYDDDFIKHFTIKTNMPALAHLFMYLRVTGIRKVISTFFESFKGQKLQLVNLGCGLDCISLWVLKKYDNVTCFDLDLEYQIKLKLEIFSRTKEILSLFPDYELTENMFKSSRYTVFPCDLRNIDELDKLKEFGFSSELPTIYLSEFVLTYVENHLSNKTNPSSFFAKWYFPLVQSLENFKDMLTLAQFCNHWVIGVACKNPNEYKNFMERFNEYELNNDDVEDELMYQFDPKDLHKEFDIVPLQQFVETMYGDPFSIISEDQKAFYDHHSITSEVYHLLQIISSLNCKYPSKNIKRTLHGRITKGLFVIEEG
ncbi:uncharacterized protein TOT_040000770 [Theileria orientalis strain Shintoku]|uniref:[phosphatase 2A protein]-leucine-carboxy methyltransferase n=1 Tax=Theileria orientalis strain Shintoku TaxID=869250 RepID=J7M8L6_THEOR|nr:uncharacterized protein TOT_040000770 [Theileria orientalis strain Shintoku]BAM42403.1 uncharacterized protein TOT_040000770 [Theileria orientalis strain Shintoku]|eukprot:XP_009692704.1 uncharacterized protein TOT_040000770 [Theileria orientalis strain Shintoku]